MTYNEATLKAVTGDTLMLPNFIGYFKWNYGFHYLEFINEDAGQKIQEFRKEMIGFIYYDLLDSRSI